MVSIGDIARFRPAYLLIIYHSTNIAILRLDRIQLVACDVVVPPIVDSPFHLVEQLRKRDVTLCIVKQKVVSVAHEVPAAVEINTSTRAGHRMQRRICIAPMPDKQEQCADYCSDDQGWSTSQMSQRFLAMGTVGVVIVVHVIEGRPFRHARGLTSEHDNRQGPVDCEETANAICVLLRSSQLGHSMLGRRDWYVPTRRWLFASGAYLTQPPAARNKASEVEAKAGGL